MLVKETISFQYFWDPQYILPRKPSPFGKSGYNMEWATMVSWTGPRTSTLQWLRRKGISNIPFWTTFILLGLPRTCCIPFHTCTSSCRDHRPAIGMTWAISGVLEKEIQDTS